jgi:hypothetical protein
MLDEKGRPKSIATEFRNGYLIANPKNLGRFSVKIDSVPPSVSPLDLTTNTLKWKVKENETDIADYDLFINGKWILMEYESKADLLFTAKPQDVKGEYELLLIVTDQVGNKTEWRKKILFK